MGTYGYHTKTCETSGIHYPYTYHFIHGHPEFHTSTFDLDQHTARHSKFSLCHILSNHTPELTNLRAGLPSPATSTKLHTHWCHWAHPIANQCDAISTHLHKSAGSMAEALRPPPLTQTVLLHDLSPHALIITKT